MGRDGMTARQYFQDDVIDHPSHYTDGIETIDYIESKGLNFSLGNAVKYISRAGKKGDPIEDLKKARWYIDREIQRLTKENLPFTDDAEDIKWRMP